MKSFNAYALNAVALLLMSSVIPVANAAPPLPTDLLHNGGAGLLMRETKEPPKIPQKKSEAVIEDTTQQQRPPMQPQNNLLRVRSCACTSNPITGSNSIHPL